ncbi:MAG TPA: hypothetical protein VF961_01025 [Pyrinomonadaceae bacterium]
MALEFFEAMRAAEIVLLAVVLKRSGRSIRGYSHAADGIDAAIASVGALFIIPSHLNFSGCEILIGANSTLFEKGSTNLKRTSTALPFLSAIFFALLMITSAQTNTNTAGQPRNHDNMNGDDRDGQQKLAVKSEKGDQLWLR